MTASAPPGPAPSPRRPADWAALGLLALCLGAFLVIRARTGLRFPAPWPDEGSFVWPSLAFRDHNTFFAPEVHPRREIYWMPPGFMLVAGLVLKVVPFGALDTVRTLSALYLVGAFACLAAALWHSRARLGHLALLALFLHACPVVRVVGNVARMESMVLLVATGGFLLLARRRGAALGVLLLGPLVHPNGLFPLAAGGLFFLVSGPRSFRFARADLALLGGAVLCWGLYAAHVLVAWDAFVTDMWSQLRFKALVSIGEGGFLKRLSERPLLLAALLLLGAQYHARKLRVRVGALSLLGGAFVVQSFAAAGWLYEVYAGIAALIGSLVTLEVAAAWLASRWPSRADWAYPVVALALLGANYRVVVQSEYVNRSLARATVTRSTREPAYMPPEDRDAVRRYLRWITAREGQVVVQFVPDADALLFEELRGPNLRFVMQTFYEHSFDVVIAHESVWYPKWIREMQLLKNFMMQGRDPTKVATIVAREKAERWVSFEWFGLPRMVPPPPSGIAEGR